MKTKKKISGRITVLTFNRIVGMMTENEWNQAVGLQNRYRDAPKIKEAARIAGELFADLESVGVLRVRQHARATRFSIPPENLAALIEDLRELLPDV